MRFFILSICASCALVIVTSNLVAQSNTVIQSQETALRLTPTNATSFIARGIAYRAKNELTEALKDFDEAVRLDPTDPIAWEGRGTVHFMKRDLNKAISDLTQAIQLDSKNATVYFNRANAYRAQGLPDMAMDDLHEAVRLNPTNSLAYACRAAIHNSRGDFNKGIADATESLRLDSTNALAYRLRGYAYFKQKYFAKAVQDWQESRRLNPRDREVLNGLGWLLATCPVESIRNGKEAIKIADEACRLTNWLDWGCVDTLAAAFAEASDFKSAIEYQTKALIMTGLPDKDRKEMEQRLDLYRKRQAYREE